jgi:hypothetical protein
MQIPHAWYRLPYCHGWMDACMQQAKYKGATLSLLVSILLTRSMYTHDFPGRNPGVCYCGDTNYLRLRCTNNCRNKKWGVSSFSSAQASHSNEFNSPPLTATGTLGNRTVVCVAQQIQLDFYCSDDVDCGVFTWIILLLFSFSSPLLASLLLACWYYVLLVVACGRLC